MFASSSEGASAAELGIEALRNSLTHVIGQLHEREAQLAAVTEERDRSKVEATRLRRELNEAFAGSSAKMMEVAMVASVQALSDEAQHQRRALAEQAILCDELRATERRLDWSERVSLEPELRAESEARGSLWWPSLDPTR